MGKVPQKIAGRADPEALQGLRASFPDPLEELDRSVETDSCRGRTGRHVPLGRLDRRLGEQIFGEPLGIERLQVFHRFSQSDEPDREPELPA